MSGTIISASAVAKYGVACEIGDLISSEMWRVDQIPDITEYSPKKKTEWAITFPHNRFFVFHHSSLHESFHHSNGKWINFKNLPTRFCYKLNSPQNLLGQNLWLSYAQKISLNMKKNTHTGMSE